MKTITEALLNLKGDVAEMKERVREISGSYKYDDCYDDVLKLIDIKIARIENNKEEK